MGLYWKSEQHRGDCRRILDKLEKTNFDAYYNSFAYLVSATGKTDVLLTYLHGDGISYEEILDGIGVFSMSEQGMIRFALHLFDAGMVTPSFHEVVSRLDSNNYRCLISAIEMRYGGLYRTAPM